MTAADIVRVLVAALGGAAVGLERQWSGHADGPGARFAGIRTFTLLGAIAGVSGVLWAAGVTALAAILLSGAAAIVAVAYAAGQSPRHRRHNRSRGTRRPRGRAARGSWIGRVGERSQRDSGAAPGGEVATAFAGAKDR